MKKLTWNEIKEKGQKFYRENKEYCLIMGGVVAGVALDMAVDLYLEKKHHPVKVDITYDLSSKKDFRMRTWNIDQYGSKTYATGFRLDPAEAIHMARNILYELAGEVK